MRFYAKFNFHRESIRFQLYLKAFIFDAMFKKYLIKISWDSKKIDKKPYAYITQQKGNVGSFIQ